jgi:hypothetical protein
MSKILFGVFSGVFIGAVIYEFINRANPELTRKVENIVSNKFDDVLGANFETAHKTHAPS